MTRLKRFAAVIAVLSGVLFCSGCGDNSILVTIIKVSPGEGKDSYYYIHRDTHTLVEVRGTNRRRMIVPGDLGTPGEDICIRNIPAALYE